MDTDRTWKKILDEIRSQISAANFKTWFSQTALKEIRERHIIVVVPSAFIESQLNARYEGLIRESVAKILNREFTLEYEVDASWFVKKGKAEPEEEEIFQPFTQSSNTQTPLLNSKYTLKNFVVGLTNNLAFAAAQAVVQNPGASYNPLFIYGPSGVGKTHLMQGIGHEVLSKNRAIRLIYAPSEKFMNDFVDSIINKRSGDFRSKYRSCDILLVDDIQFISGKDSMQEEFFHTFNELQSRNCQIVLTSDRPPHEIQKLESRLASRFQGGLMVDVQLPDFDTRVAIVKAKLSEKNEVLPDEIVSLIAEKVASNTRELEGKLIQVLQASKLTNQPVTIEFTERFLGPVSIKQNQNIDPKKVLGGINQYFNTRMVDLTGPRRHKELVLPRQIAMYLIYEECKLPMEKIGELLGGRDHTTVLHGIEKIRFQLTQDREVQKLVGDLKQQLIG